MPFVYAAGVRSSNPSGNQQINYASSASSRDNSWLYGALHIYGTATEDASGFLSPNRIVVSDGVDASGADYLDHLLIAASVSGHKGSRNAVHGNINISGAPDESTHRAYVGALTTGVASVNHGGDGSYTTNPSAGYVGGLFGGNDHPRLASGATYWYSVIGREINFGIESGASAFAKIGLFVVPSSGDAAAADGEVNAGICIAGKSGLSSVLTQGLLFGASWGAWPFGSSSTLIGVQRILYTADGGSPPALYGVDFSDLSITAGGAAFLAPLITPGSASATGKAGSIVWDGSYIYICTATDTWKRVAIATW